MSTSLGSVSSGTGLVSGIDYSSLISKIISADSAPVTTLQTKESTIKTQESALGSIQSSLSSLCDTLSSLTDAGSFYSLSATSSDSTVASATIDSGNTASAGSHTVLVKQLAQGCSVASQGWADSDKTAIASSAGTFSFKLGTDGSTTSIAVSATMSLQGLADAINNAGAGVTASVIDDGSASNPYRLVLTSDATGTANQINIVSNTTSLNLSTPSIASAVASGSNAFNGTATSSGTFTGDSTENIVCKITSAGAVGTAAYKVSLDGGVTWQDGTHVTSTDATDVSGGDGVNVAFAAGTKDFAVGDTFSIDAFNPNLQAATDAIVKVDGIQVTRSSNAIDDVIKGVTLNLTSVSSTSQTINVTSNSSSIQGTISSFVSAYNSAIAEINNESSYNTSTNTAATLFGDSGVANIKAALESIVKAKVNDNDGYSSLSDIGITFNSDYSLEVDTDKLGVALKDNPEAVSKLFTSSGASTSTNVIYNDATSATQSGTYAIKVITAAKQASVSGTTALSSGTSLTSNETLSIATADSTVKVSLKSGMSKDDILATLNAALDKASAGVTASVDDSGYLTFTSDNYGSDETLSVKSSSSGSQVGFSTTATTDKGVDVVANVGGVQVTGSGQKMIGTAGTAIEGLDLTLTGAAGSTASITINKGVATQLTELIDGYNDATSGFFQTRADAYDKQTTDIDKRITTLQDRLNSEQSRLEKQFTKLETELGSLSSISSTVTSTLASAVTSLSNSSVANSGSS